MTKIFSINKMLLTIGVAAMVVSCDTIDDFELSTETFDSSSITFEGSVTTRATDTAFESGDEISVTAYNSDGTTYASNVSYTYNNSIFSSESPIKYESDDHALSFTAIYPYVELPESSNTITFSILTDQNSTGNYSLSDLMTSSISSTTSTTPTLTFDHLLTKIIINVTSEDVVMTNVTTTIYVATEVEYNLSTLSSVSTTDINSVTMANYGVNSYKAIIVPQNIDAGTTFGKISVDGVEFDIVFESKKLFYAGREYEFDLSINNGSITFISSSINDWDEGGDGSEEINEFSLSEFSSTSYPLSSGAWIITDTEATYDDMSGLRDALSNYSRTAEKIVLEFPNLTSLPEKALYNSDGVESVTLASATSIGANACYGCDYLTLIEAPLVDVIDTYAFYGCSALVSIDLSSTTSIGNYAFYGCSSLAALSLPEVTTIGNYAFQSCSSLTTVSLPKVIDIGSSALYSCSLLTTVSLPVATNIGNTAFKYCTALTTVYLPEAITVGSSAFSGCSSLVSLSLPETTSIGSSAFSSCTSLVTLYLPEITTVGSYAFYGCSSLTTVSFPEATSVGNYAFYSCTSLTTLSLPELASVGTSVFYGCTSLTTASFPMATSLSSSAFKSCTSLQSVSVPSLSVIYDGTFSSCSTLTSLEVASNDGVELTQFGTYGSDLFDGIDVSSMTLTTGSTNSDMVNDNYFTAPSYESSTSSYPNSTYGPFREIVVK